MKLPITTTEGHQGKAFEFDCDRETMTLLDERGAKIATITWEDLIRFLRASSEEQAIISSRNYPRAPLAVKVRYLTKDGKKFESLTGGVGGGGMFIESSAPLPEGTELTLEFNLPDRPSERLTAKAVVAWTRKKAERYLLFPGMGVQFTEIEADDRKRVQDLVSALNRSRQPT